VSYQCNCECHRTCHTCGRPFIGPNDYHINCGDTIQASGSIGNFTANKDRMEPWPTQPKEARDGS